MKKILSILSFLIVPLLVAIPGFMGWHTEKNMRATAEYIDALPDYSANWQSYNRGWFTSSGILNLTLNFNHIDQGGVTLPVSFSLQHGPLLWGSKIGLGWFDLEVNLNEHDEQSLKDILQVKGEGPVYRLVAQMGLWGVTHFNDRWLAFDYKDDLHVSVQSYNGIGSIDNHLQLKYNYRLPYLSIKNGQTDALNITDINGQIEIDLANLHAANVAPAKFDMAIGGIESKSISNDEYQFKLNDLILSMVTSVDKEQSLFGSRLKLTLGKFEAPTQDLLLEQLHIEMSYLQINLEFLKSYQVLIEQAPVDAGASYWQSHAGNLILNEFLPSSPKLSVDSFAFKTLRGDFALSSVLSVDGEAVQSAQLDPQNPFGLLPFLKLNIDANADKDLALHLADLYLLAQSKQSSDNVSPSARPSPQRLTQARELIDLLRSQNIIVDNNNKWSLGFALSKGQATLNDQPLPLPF